MLEKVNMQDLKSLNFKVDYIPMEDFGWILEGNLGARGFEQEIKTKIDTALNQNGIDLTGTEIQEQLIQEDMFIKVFEYYSEFNEDVYKHNIPLDLAESRLIMYLIEYYLQIKRKVDLYILSYKRNL